MLRVLIADKLTDSARTALQGAGCEVIFEPALKEEALTAALAEHGPDVLVVRSTKVRQEHLTAHGNLQLVVRAGAGVNTIDIDAASARGIYVSNCPGTNSVAVAELTFAHILNADRRVADNVQDLREGRWAKKLYSQAKGLKGRTLGVIGCGAIGREVIRRAHAFDMPVVAWSRSLTPEDAAAMGARYAESAIEVARQCEVLSVHLAVTPATKGIIGEAIFQALRPGAIFVNTSRGAIVDDEALRRALDAGHLRAGLDVFNGEPASDGDWVSELAQHPAVYGTHHIGASTAQAQEAVADEAVRVILSWRDTGAAPNCVNMAVTTEATHSLVVRHEDRVGVLAEVLDQLRRHAINVQEMENAIFLGGQAACARIRVESAPPPELLDALRAMEPIFDVKLVAPES